MGSDTLQCASTDVRPPGMGADSAGAPFNVTPLERNQRFAAAASTTSATSAASSSIAPDRAAG